MAAVWTMWLLTYERTGAKRMLADLSTQNRLHPEWRWNKCKSLVILSLPLGVVSLLLSLNANMPRYFIEHFMGEGALGYFAAMAYIFLAGNTLMAALGQSALPRLVRHFTSDPAAFVHLLKNMVFIGVLVGMAGICLAISFGSSILQVL
jgi:O-antigen/teichoic acid export membrane protein